MKQVFTIFLLTILMSMVGTKMNAYDFKKDGFYYNLDSYDMTAIVTYGENPYKGNIIIPNEVSYNGRTMSVRTVGESAFKDCVDLTSIQFSNSISYIEERAFQNCTKIRKLTIPSNIGRIDRYAFYGCESLEELIIEDGESGLSCGENGTESPSSVFDCKLKYLYIGRDIGYPGWGRTYDLDNTNLSTIIIGSGKTFVSGFKGAKITKITIPSNVISIAEGAFMDCKKLESVYFEDSDKELVWQEAYDTTIDSGMESVSPFYDCPIKDAYIGRNITPTKGNIYLSGYEGPFDRTTVEKITISNSVTSLCGIAYCDNIKELVIPSSVQEVCGFRGSNSLMSVKCLNPTPPMIKRYSTLAENSTYLNGILYVPTGSVDIYKKDENWGKFFNIQEISNYDPSAKQRCEKPTISYNKGKILFYSVTDGSICHSTITDNDISTYVANEVQLEVTYNISVYATKPGYDDSETATATLCWIDQQPTTEGITNDISQIPAKAVLIQSQSGMLTIQGVDDGSQIAVYTISGQMVGSTKANGNQASLATNIKKGEVAIVKIGEKSVKVVMQ